MVLSERAAHSDGDSPAVLGLAKATASQAAHVRRLARAVRLASASLRETVGSTRSGGAVEDLLEVRSVLAGARQRADNLQRALISNRRIGMAIGILMVTRHLPEAEAFECLKQESQRRNVKLRDVAEQVIYTGSL